MFTPSIYDCYEYGYNHPDRPILWSPGTDLRIAAELGQIDAAQEDLEEGVTVN